MVQADGADIGVSLFIVVLGQAIPGTPVDPHGFTVEKRKTVVRNVVFVLEKVTEVHLGRRAKAQAESWSEALAGYFDMISVDDIDVVGHGVQTKSHRRAERLIDVRGAAEVRAASGASRAIVEALELGSLADLVDDSAGGAPSEVDRCGSLEHFDVLNIEGVAEIGPLIAHAIQVHVVARAEAAQGKAVPLRATSFTGGNTDAGNVAHRAAQGRRRLFVHDFSWHNGDGLGNVLDRLGQALQPQVRHDIRTLLLGDCYLGQRRFFLLLLFRWFGFRRLWFRRETVGCQSERKGHGSADTLTGGKSDLVEDLIPPSFIGASFLSTHGFLQSVILYRCWHESPHTLAG